MNTYTVTLFPTGSTVLSPTYTIPAKEFVVDRDFVVFIGPDGATSVAAFPLDLNPVIQLTQEVTPT
jgi:hypothetical protein